jgi:hypothetical protein
MHTLVGKPWIAHSRSPADEPGVGAGRARRVVARGSPTAEYLGHSPAALLSTYAHLMPADHEQARSAVETAVARDVACHPGVTEAKG